MFKMLKSLTLEFFYILFCMLSTLAIVHNKEYFIKRYGHLFYTFLNAAPLLSWILLFTRFFLISSYNLDIRSSKKRYHILYLTFVQTMRFNLIHTLSYKNKIFIRNAHFGLFLKNFILAYIPSILYAICLNRGSLISFSPYLLKAIYKIYAIKPC